MNEFDEFKSRRDAMLLRGDLAELDAYLRAHGRAPSSMDAVELALHKARTAAETLPMEIRSASKKWLLDRGFHSLDDGDVV